MKVTNITDKTSKPAVVSVLINVKGKDQRLDLNPGESIYSNGDFNALFNKTLRVFKQKGLVQVVDENDLEQMAKDEQEALDLELLKKQEAEEQKAVEKLKGSAFDNTDLLPETVYHPDVLIVVPKKEVDYSSNVLPDPEEEKPSSNKKSKKKE